MATRVTKIKWLVPVDAATYSRLRTVEVNGDVNSVMRTLFNLGYHEGSKTKWAMGFKASSTVHIVWFTDDKTATFAEANRVLGHFTDISFE